MKGLVLKEFYLFWSYGKTFVILGVLSAAFGIWMQNLAPLIFMTLFLGMMPMSLQAYDEKSKWMQYALNSMPVTKADLVSSKFILSTIIGFATSLLSALCTAVSGQTSLLSVLSVFSLCFLVNAVSSIMMLLVFWLGAEKGRLVYCIFGGVLGALIGSTVGSYSQFPKVILDIASGPLLIPALLLISSLILGVSWLLSVKLFERRDL